MAGYSVMIVEDDYSNMKVFEYMMKMLGLHYERAENGTQAISGFDPDRHKIVLIDINLPDINGYDVLQQMKERCGSDPSICFIAQTAKVSSMERLRCIEMGFTDYISKPISFSSFRTMMETVLANYPEGAFRPETDVA